MTPQETRALDTIRRVADADPHNHPDTAESTTTMSHDHTAAPDCPEQLALFDTTSTDPIDTTEDATMSAIDTTAITTRVACGPDLDLPGDPDTDVVDRLRQLVERTLADDAVWGHDGRPAPAYVRYVDAGIPLTDDGRISVYVMLIVDAITVVQGRRIIETHWVNVSSDDEDEDTSLLEYVACDIAEDALAERISAHNIGARAIPQLTEPTK